MATANPDPDPLNNLTAFQRDLMAVVAGMDDPHGLGIKDELEQHYNAEVNHGHLYPNLDTLCDKGLVSKAEKDRRTNAYSLTSRGRRELAAHQAWTEQAINGGETA